MQLYEERKHTIRLFLCGLAALLVAGMMLGWTTMRVRARVPVMTVFFVCIVYTAYHLVFITRPRFRVPKELRGKNKPGVFQIGGFNPELGQQQQQQQHTTTVLYNALPRNKYG